jgi:hypothetical protein
MDGGRGGRMVNRTTGPLLRFSMNSTSELAELLGIGAATVL